MTQRVLRFPPTTARLIRLEEGPPMYRMQGYADHNNRCNDLCFPDPCGFIGPFGLPRWPPNQTVSVGPGRFGLPMTQLAFTTYYWDNRVFPYHSYIDGRTLNRMYTTPFETRPEAVSFPERAVPGTGVNSKCVDSACLYYRGLSSPNVGMC